MLDIQLACRLGAQRKPLPVAQEVPQRTANVTPDNSDGVCVCVEGENRTSTHVSPSLGSDTPHGWHFQLQLILPTRKR